MPVGGVGFASKSHVKFGASVRISPLTASHMLMIRALDWNLSYHCPQLGPSKVGMRNLLISIFVKYFYCLTSSLRMKGAYTSRCQMPREVIIFGCCLACRMEGAYTSRCQMPEFEQFEVGNYFFKREMVHILVTIQNHSD